MEFHKLTNDELNELINNSHKELQYRSLCSHDFSTDPIEIYRIDYTSSKGYFIQTERAFLSSNKKYLRLEKDKDKQYKVNDWNINHKELLAELKLTRDQCKSDLAKSQEDYNIDLAVFNQIDNLYKEYLNA